MIRERGFGRGFRQGRGYQEKSDRFADDREYGEMEKTAVVMELSAYSLFAL